MQVRLAVDPTSAVAGLADTQRRQIPFALKTAVNVVGLKVQAAERAHLASAFTIRRASFIEKQGVKVLDGFATKARPSITIGPDDKARFLDKFEAGGDKTPTGDRASLAIPVDVKRNKADIVTAANRPRALLAKAAAATTPAGQGKVFIVRVGETVVHAGKRLAPGVYQRVGGKTNPHLKLLYLLKPKVTVKAVLRLVETARTVVQREFDAAFRAALDAALASAR